MNHTTRCRKILYGAAIVVSLIDGNCAWAWGDDGHKVVALIAEYYLDPAVKRKIEVILATDHSGLAHGTDIASEATWADKYRDSDRNTTRVRYKQTFDWHFTDIELQDGDIDAACFGHPATPPDTPASQGPQQDCVIDKIDEFAAELANPATSVEERLLALQFLLHFIGDLHQPLHSSDDHDKGGNDKMVAARGIAEGNLHHYWDTEFVRKLGTNPKKVANDLIVRISAAELRSWRSGTTNDWAMQSYRVAKSKTYDGLGKPDAKGKYTLSDAYVKNATAAVAQQMSRAGVRLALVLKRSLGEIALDELSKNVRSWRPPCILDCAASMK